MAVKTPGFWRPEAIPLVRNLNGCEAGVLEMQFDPARVRDDGSDLEGANCYVGADVLVLRQFDKQAHLPHPGKTAFRRARARSASVRRARRAVMMSVGAGEAFSGAAANGAGALPVGAGKGSTLARSFTSGSGMTS